MFQINGYFSTNAAVDLRQSGSRNTDKFNTAQISRRYKTRQISDDAAAQCDNAVCSGKVQFQQFPAKFLINRKRFCPSPAEQYDNIPADTVSLLYLRTP